MIALVTDSTANISLNIAQELGVRVVPNSYIIGGRIFSESHTDNNAEYLKLIPDSALDSYTAYPNVHLFSTVFKELLDENCEILCMVISSRLSGAFTSANIAAKEAGEAGITVFDTLSAAGGMRFLLQKAREAIDSGMSRKEIVSLLTSARNKVRIAFTVDDMSALRRSGRLSAIRKSVGTILNIRPVFHLADGAVISSGTARGRLDLLRQLTSGVSAANTHILVHYVKNTDLAYGIMDRLRNIAPEARLELSQVGPVIGINLGLSAAGLSYMDTSTE